MTKKTDLEYTHIVSNLLKGKSICLPSKDDTIKLQKQSIQVPAYKEIIRAHKTIPWYSELALIYEEAYSAELVRNIIIHGSYGDFSPTHFSDLEISVILNHKVFLSKEKTLALNKWLRSSLNKLILKVDPLQHHGAFFLWDQLLKHYDEHILPVSAYDNAWAILPEKLDFYIERSIANKVEISHKKYLHTLNAILTYQKTFFQQGVNLYSIKRMLSNFFMLPVFYFQSHGMPINKKQALELIRQKNLCPSFYLALDLASEIRNSWPPHTHQMFWLRSCVFNGRFNQNRINAFILNTFQNKHIKQKFQSEFLPQALKACEILRSKLI
ncbi:MAG: hypothetical protein IGS03_05295 [Candidatus Sericytochromatia bacterium]|nr:hypothetical protein [Candidatus Sericytochromatia bacterium]